MIDARRSRRHPASAVVAAAAIAVFAGSSDLWASQAPVPPAKPNTPPKSGEQSTPPPADKPAQAPPAKPEGKTLDELLGIPPAAGKGGERSEGKADDKPADGSDAGPKPDDGLTEAKQRLERGLSEAEVDSLLRQALAGMESSVARLAKQTDSGLGTQRVQEDVVAKLDQLIEEAKRRSKQGQKGSKSSSSSSSSSSSQSKQSAGDKPGDPQQGKVGDSKSRGDGQRKTSAHGAKEGDGPPPIDPEKDQAALDETQAEWGALPERVRDLIRQGARDRVASIYQRLTQEYYRRMAEEASR